MTTPTKRKPWACPHKRRVVEPLAEGREMLKVWCKRCKRRMPDLPADPDKALYDVKRKFTSRPTRRGNNDMGNLGLRVYEVY